MALNKIYTITQGKTDKDDYHKCKMFKDKERHYWWGWRFKSRWKEKWQTYDKIYQNIWNLQCYKKRKTYKTRPQNEAKTDYMKHEVWGGKTDILHSMNNSYAAKKNLLWNEQSTFTDWCHKATINRNNNFLFLTSPSLCS